MKITRWGILAVLVLAGCGGAGTSTTTSGGNATRGATSSALSAANSSANTGTSNAALVVQALRAGVKAATVTIPEMTTDVSFACNSGSADVSVTISGTVTTNDATGELTSMDIDMSNTMTFNTCAPEDIASTSDIDESDYALDGTLTGTGSIGATSGTVSFSMTMDGPLTISGTCTGTLTFDMSVSGSGTATSLDCTGSGSVTGTVCDEAVSCTVSGDCENPTVNC